MQLPVLRYMLMYSRVTHMTLSRKRDNRGALGFDDMKINVVCSAYIAAVNINKRTGNAQCKLSASARFRTAGSHRAVHSRGGRYLSPWQSCFYEPHACLYFWHIIKHYAPSVYDVWPRGRYMRHYVSILFFFFFFV